MARRTFGADPGPDPGAGRKAAPEIPPKAAPEADRKGGASCFQVIGWSLMVVIAVPLVISTLSYVTSSQWQWANAVSGIDGVMDVEVESPGGIAVPEEHHAEIVVSPDFTEEQARAVAYESCRHDTNFDSVTVDTSWPRSYPPSDVDDPDSYAQAQQACFPVHELVRYSHTYDDADYVIPQ